MLTGTGLIGGPHFTRGPGAGGALPARRMLGGAANVALNIKALGAGPA
jgi:hypothetical protein